MYCKKCVCGYVNVYEQAGMAPAFCGKCPRSLARITEEHYEEPKAEQPELPANGLFLQYGDELLLVDRKMIVGRNSEAREWFGEYRGVGRQHFEIEPRASGIGANITDISSVFTLVNGKKLEKHVAKRILPGAVISLSGLVEIKLIKK